MWGAFVYFVFPIALGFISYSIWRRMQMWRTGAPISDLDPWPRLFLSFLKLATFDIVAHRKFVHREMYAGIMHFSLFWGFSILFVATTLLAIEFNLKEYAGWDSPTAWWRVQTSLLWDVGGGLLATLGIAMAVLRRYVLRPDRLNTFLDDGYLLGLLGLLVFTGFLVEGLRIASTELNPDSALYDPSAAKWSPIGWLFAKTVIGIGIRSPLIQTIHSVTWWSHAAIVTVGFMYISLGWSKLMHILVSPLNSLLKSSRPRGALRPMGDFESLSSF